MFEPAQVGVNGVGGGVHEAHVIGQQFGAVKRMLQNGWKSTRSFHRIKPLSHELGSE